MADFGYKHGCPPRARPPQGSSTPSRGVLDRRTVPVVALAKPHGDICG